MKNTETQYNQTQDGETSNNVAENSCIRNNPKPDNKDKNKKRLFLFLRLAISVGLISYFVVTLASKNGGIGPAFRKFVDAFSGASIQWLLVAGLLHIIGFSLMSVRWGILLNAQGAHSSFKQLFTYYIMAAFFNTFLPSTIGGDTVRALEAKKLTGSTTMSVMVVLVERLTGLIALVIIAGAGLIISTFMNPGQEGQAWFLLVAALIALCIAIVLAHPSVAPRFLKLTARLLPAKVQGFIEKAYAAVETYYRKPGYLFAAQLVSIVFQLNMVVYYFLIALALHQAPDPIDFMMKVPVVIFLLMTVPAINGLGVRTATFKELMQFSNAYALTVESIDIAFRVFYGLVGGLIFLFYKRKN